MLLLKSLVATALISLSQSSNNEQHRSLVFIFDVSPSMSNGIDALRTESMLLLDGINLYWSHFFNYILVQFSDEDDHTDIIEPFVDTNYLYVKNNIGAMRVNGREKSCKASCLRGLKRALELANDDSIVLVFTDGGTKHTDLLPELKERLAQKRITIYFTLVKGCDWTNAANDYRELVKIFNGEVFAVTDNGIERHFQLLSQILLGPPIAPRAKALVDMTVSDFILTATGQNLIVTIFDPTNKYVPSTRYELLTDLPNIKMIKVGDPKPGRWKVDILSETPYNAQLTLQSDLKFNYGFAVNEPTSMDETNYIPLRGYDTYLAVQHKGSSHVQNLDHVILTTTSNREYEYKLHSTPGLDDGLYLTDSFSIPSDSFKIHIHGTDQMNNSIVRLISPNISPGDIEKPEIWVDQNIIVQEGEPIVLNCQITSMVDVTASWSKLNSTLSSIKSKQSNQLKFTIDNSKISDMGEYVCSADNIAGLTKAMSVVTIRQTKFYVSTPHTVVNSIEGESRLELTCSVMPNPEFVNVTWLFNGKPILPSGSKLVSSNLVLFNIQRNLSGKYTCIGQKQADVNLNVMYAPLILGILNSDLYHVIDKNQDLEVGQNENLNLFCMSNGKPVPSVKWIDTTGMIVSNDAKLELSESQIGEFTCKIENHLGADELKIKIIRHNEPSSKPLEVQTKNSGSITNEPNAEVNTAYIFEDDEVEIDIGDETIKLTTQWKRIETVFSTTSMPIISTAVSNEYETYDCVTGNPANSSISSKTITSTSIKPAVIADFNKTIELVEGHYFTMTCPIASGDYNVTWFLNGKIRDDLKLDDQSIYIDSVKGSMNGEVICVASNNAGSANATFHLEVLTPPFDLQSKTSPFTGAIVNSPFNISCSAHGNPVPKIFWWKDGQYFMAGNSIHFTVFRRENSGEYTCIAENLLGNRNATLNVRVDVPPTMINSTGFLYATNSNSDNKLGVTVLNFVSVRSSYFDANYSQTIQVNESQRIILNCSMFGDPPPEITWYKNGYKLDSISATKWAKNQSTIEFWYTTVADSGIYKCVGSNRIAQLKVMFYVNIMKQATIESATSSKTVYEPNEPITIICSAKGNPLPVLQISFNRISTSNFRTFSMSSYKMKQHFYYRQAIFLKSHVIIDKDNAISRNEYSVVTYEEKNGEYIGTLRYIIKSAQPKHAGLYQCIAGSLSLTFRTIKNIEIHVEGESAISKQTHVTKQKGACNGNRCPIDGGWGQWRQYTVCSKSCVNRAVDFSMRKDIRDCDNPKPEYNGKFCVGPSEQLSICKVPLCVRTTISPFVCHNGYQLVNGMCKPKEIMKCNAMPAGGCDPTTQICLQVKKTNRYVCVCKSGFYRHHSVTSLSKSTPCIKI